MVEFCNAPFEIEFIYFSQENLDVTMFAHDPADGSSDFSGRQSGCCHLIQQRLKIMVISAVDQCDFYRQVGKTESRIQASKSRSDNHNLGGRFEVHPLFSPGLQWNKLHST